MKLHPAARLFPQMSDEALQALVEDIKKSGQLEPVLLLDEQIIDGRNRWRACKELGLDPWTVQWKDVRSSPEASPTEYVVSKNLHRRHLSPTQRAVVAASLSRLYEAEAQERRRAGAVKGNWSPARRKHPLVAKAQQPGSQLAGVVDKASAKATPEAGEKAPAKKPSKTPRAKTSAERAAEQVGVSPRYVSEAKAIKKTAPELTPLMETKDITMVEAKKLAALDKKARSKVLARGKRVGYRTAILEHGQAGSAGPEAHLLKLIKAAARNLAKAVAIAHEVHVQEHAELSAEVAVVWRHARDLRRACAKRTDAAA